MSKCQNVAAFRYTWPGRDESVICVQHASYLQKVANAIGLHVQLIPIVHNANDPILNCQQEVSNVDR